jgi:hypothetical protein
MLLVPVAKRPSKAEEATNKVLPMGIFRRDVTSGVVFFSVDRAHRSFIWGGIQN